MISGRGRRRFGLLISATLCGALGAGAVTALAQIPDGDSGLISGCYKTIGGTLRLIDAEGGATCKAGETPISWNQQGVPGTPGTPGAPGAPGTPGVSGYEVVTEFTPLDNEDRKSLIVVCPDGKVAIGGGGAAQDAGGLVGITVSAPIRHTWFIEAREEAGFPDEDRWILGGTVVCANV